MSPDTGRLPEKTENSGQLFPLCFPVLTAQAQEQRHTSKPVASEQRSDKYNATWLIVLKACTVGKCVYVGLVERFTTYMHTLQNSIIF